MRRIKLSRPPPVSSETVEDTVSDNTVVDSLSNSTQAVVTKSQSGDVSAFDISTDVEKSPSDTRLINRKGNVTVAADTRRVVKHKHTVVQDVLSESLSQSSSNVLVASDSSVKEPKKKQQRDNVVSQTDTVQASLHGNDCVQSSYAGQHIGASTGNTVSVCEDTASVAHGDGSSKTPSKTVVDKTSSDTAEYIPSASYDVSSKGISDSSFRDNFCSTLSSQDTVARVECQESVLESDKKLHGSLLDEVLKGFLVQKLAVIESERKGTDVDCKGDSVEAVVVNEPEEFSPASRSKRCKRSRESEEQHRHLEHLPELPPKLKDREQYTDSHHLPPHTLHSCEGDSAKSVVPNEPEEFSPAYRLKRRKRSRHSEQQHTHLEHLAPKLRDRDKTLYQCGEQYTDSHVDAGYPKSHAHIHHGHHLPLHTLYSCKGDSAKAVVPNAPEEFPPAYRLKRHKRSRHSEEQHRHLEHLPPEFRDRDKTFYYCDEQYTDSHGDAGYPKSHAHIHHGHHLPPHTLHSCKGDSAVVPNEPEGFSPASRLKRRERSRESEVQHTRLEHLPLTLRDREKTLYCCDEQYTDSPGDAGYPKSHAHIHHRHHLPPHTLHSFPSAEDATKCDFGAKVSNFRRDHRKRKHSARHSLQAKRHLLNSGKKRHQTEHRKQFYDFPQLEINRYNEQKSFDCIEQVRQFVSHTAHKLSPPMSQDHAPLESYHENSDLTHGRERQKSGSTDSRHRLKKHKSAMLPAVDKLGRHRCVKHRSGKKSLQTTKNVKEDKLANKKCRKHKHKHHRSKNLLPDATVDHKELDKNETSYHTEPKDAEGDAFSKSRSLSPLGLHRKHHKKHKKKKSKDSTASAQNVSLLPETSNTQCDKVVSDEEFVPMKVQKKDDDGETAALKVPHKVDVSNTAGVKQSETGSKSAAEPKRRTCVSDTNPSAEVQMSAELCSSNAEEHQVQAATEDQFQKVNDTATDPATTEDTVTLSVTSVQDYAGQTGTSPEASAPSGSTASQQVNNCDDADNREALQTMTVNVDKVSDEVTSERHTLSMDEVNVASKISTVVSVDSDNLTASFRSDEIIQLGENKQQESVDVAMELYVHKDNECTGKIVSSDKTCDTVVGEELKSCSEESTTDEAYKSASNASETPAECHPDVERDEVGEKTPTERQDKIAEKVISEELEAVSEGDENSADQHRVSGETVASAVNRPLQPDQAAGTEPSAMPDITPGEGNNVVNTVSTAEDISSSNADEKVDESHTAVPSNLMGPPLALPPSAAFKKPLPMMKMNVRITDSSADFISSGARTNDRRKKARSDESREEGNQVVLLLIT